MHYATGLRKMMRANPLRRSMRTNFRRALRSRPATPPPKPAIPIPVRAPADEGTVIPVRTPRGVVAAKALAAAESKSRTAKGQAGELAARAAIPLVCAQLDTHATTWRVNPHHQGIDILARTIDGRVLVVEVKNHAGLDPAKPARSLSKGKDGKPDQMTPEWISSRLERAVERSDGNGDFAAIAGEARGGAGIVPVLVAVTADGDLSAFVGLGADGSSWDHPALVPVM